MLSYPLGGDYNWRWGSPESQWENMGVPARLDPLRGYGRLPPQGQVMPWQTGQQVVPYSPLGRGLTFGPSMGQAPIEMPSAVPYDPTTLTNYILPAALSKFQSNLSAEEMEKRALLGEKYGTKYGLGPALGEVPPETRATMERTLSNALRDWDASMARSGMPISSVAEFGRGDIMGSFAQTLARLAAEYGVKGKVGLADYIRSWAGR